MNENNNINVLHIASGDLWAGAEVQLFTLAKSLHDNFDISVYVVLLNHGELERKLRDNGINVTVINEENMNGFKILISLVRTIRNYSPDIIHTHRIKENVLGSIAALLAGGVPSIRTVHGAQEHYPGWRQITKHMVVFFDAFCGRFIQKKIIAVSDDLCTILKKTYPLSRINVIENGIDVDYVRNQSKEIRNAKNPSETVFRLGIAGRLVPVKRVDFFIETAKYMLAHYPNIILRFYIFGDGPLRDDLIKLSRELDISDCVKFEGHCDNMAQKLAELDLLLMTSDHEGLPMILLEAMALQVPVVAHAIGGIPKLLDQGACGGLVSNHSPSGYSKITHHLLSHPDIRKNITENALARVKNEYSAETNARAYLNEYLSAINI